MPDSLTDYKVILFSPRVVHRNVFLNSFINRPDAYYYALTSGDTTLDNFLRNLIHALSADNPSFGTQTKQALEAKKVKVGDLAETLKADLRTLKPRAALLILDDFDYLSITQDVIAFLEKFVTTLGSDLQLVVNARSLSYEPWQTLVHSGQAVVLGEDEALDGGILTPTAKSNRPHLEVYAFGQGKAFVNGREIQEWDGPLPRRLFFYFIDHPMATREELFQVFWPGIGEREATNVFHVTKRKITERLGFEVADYSSRFYQRSRDVILHYDVEAFEKDIAQAARLDSEEAWSGSLKLYRNAYLMTSDMPWINERREALRTQYTSALIEIGRIHQTRNESDLAILYYLRALNEAPDREDVHRQLMTLYTERGEHDKARAQYQILKDHLRRTHGIAPSAVTRELFEKIRA